MSLMRTSGVQIVLNSVFEHELEVVQVISVLVSMDH